MRDLESDPELALPIGVTKRKTLARTRQRLAALIKDRDSAAAMAEELDQQARLDDALRTAAAQGDAESVRGLATRGGRPPKQQRFKRRGRDALLAAVGSALAFALATESRDTGLEEEDYELEYD